MVEVWTFVIDKQKHTGNEKTMREERKIPVCKATIEFSKSNQLTYEAIKGID